MKKFYITTSIAYTNADPHIGFALESIQADVLARYHRLLQEDVFFLTGVDQHGLKIAQKAQKENKEPIDFVRPITDKFKELTKVLDISNDDFIETIDQEKHWPSVKKVWSKLLESGDIHKKKYQGFYCVGCEAFVKKSDLVEKMCPHHQKEPELIEEENYFFKLSKYAQKVKELIEKNIVNVVPETRKNEILSFIGQGVEDISISRDKEKLTWGIPVPNDESQTMYVWVDALTNYISALGYDQNKEKFQRYWPADVHCLGKDIFRFHCLLWPAILLSLGLDLPKNIFIHGFITVDGQKMSKSIGNVIDPFEIIEKYGVDSLRYYLLREIPSAKDGDFTIEKFESRYNSDLASGLGNLFSRVKKMAENGFQKEERDLFKIKEKEKRYHQYLDNFQLNEALAVIFEIIKQADIFIEKNKVWEKKGGKEIGYLLQVLEKISYLLEPFLPKTVEKMKEGITPLFPRI